MKVRVLSSAPFFLGFSRFSKNPQQTSCVKFRKFVLAVLALSSKCAVSQLPPPDPPQPLQSPLWAQLPSLSLSNRPPKLASSNDINMQIGITKAISSTLSNPIKSGIALRFIANRRPRITKPKDETITTPRFKPFRLRLETLKPFRLRLETIFCLLSANCFCLLSANCFFLLYFPLAITTQ